MNYDSMMRLVGDGSSGLMPWIERRLIDGGFSDPERLLATPDEEIGSKTAMTPGAVRAVRRALRHHVASLQAMKSADDLIAIPATEALIEDCVAPTDSIHALGLSVRTRNCLGRVGITTISHLASLDRGRLQAIPNLGLKSLHEIETAVARFSTTTAIRISPTPVAPVRAARTPGDVPTEELPLSARTTNVLLRAGVETLDQLACTPRSVLRQLRGLGVSGLREIERACEGHLPHGDPVQPIQPPPPSARVLELTTLCDKGITLDEMGRELGVTRERVRQLLGRHDLHERWTAAKRRRREESSPEEASAIQSLYEDGLAPDEITRQLSLARPAIDRTLETLPLAELSRARHLLARVRRRPGYERRHTDGEILDAIRWATAHLGRTPSTSEYRDLAIEHELPGLQTAAIRFDTWKNAVEAAGLTTAGTGRGNYTRRWTTASCWRALVDFCGSLDGPPSAQHYELIAAGDDDIPSLATLRNRLGGWSEVAALAYLHSVEARHVIDRLHLDRLDLDADALYLAFLDEEISESELLSLTRAGLFDPAAFGLDREDR